MTADHPRTIGPYEVLGVLGQGAMGQVYKAVEPAANRLVAIKVLPRRFAEDATRVERFEREVKAVSLLDHRNVVKILGQGSENELPYFVMEYVPGTSLDAVMRQRRLSLHEVFSVARGICRGLEAAHRQNIVHRDLNPRNVLVSEDLSVVKLADFGISRVETISRQQGTLSTAELSLGTLHYMAPEQAADMAGADHRADIYAVGVTLYEMLTGRVPVGRFSLPSQLNSEIPPDIDPVVLRCLETDPAARYPTVGRLLADLDRLEDRLRLGLVDELRGISRGTSKILLHSTRSVLRGRKRRLVLAAVAVLVVLGAGAAYLVLGRDAPSTAAPRAGETEIAALEPAAGREEPAPEPAAAEAAEEQEPAPAPPPAAATPRQPPARPAPAAARPAATPEPAVAEVEREDLRVASDKFAAGLFGPALADLERFVADHPDSNLLPEAYWLTALVHREEGRTEQALATLVEIGSRFPDSPRAAEAAFEHARLVHAAGDRDSLTAARDLYQAVADGFPASNQAPAALAARAEIELELKSTATDPQLGRVPAALLTYRDLTARYPRAAQSERALWELGTLCEEEKAFELAAAAFSQLGERFPRTGYDAWWKAGQILDRKLDRKDEAVLAYQKVPDSSRHFDDAKRRINRLTR